MAAVADIESKTVAVAAPAVSSDDRELETFGWLMEPLRLSMSVSVLGSAIAFAFVLDAIKVPLFNRLGLTRAGRRSQS